MSCPPYFSHLFVFWLVFHATDAVKCKHVFPKGEYIVTNGDDAFIPALNRTIPSAKLRNDDNHTLCLLEELSNNTLFMNCTIEYHDSKQYEVLANGSVDKKLLPEDAYEFELGKLKSCATQDEKPHDLRFMTTLYIEIVGAVISVICLIIHLGVFVSLPSLQNVPGYNLSSLSVAFLGAYCFTLVGQIPGIKGTWCIAFAYLGHYFYMTTFFWMNVMCYDIWRVLRMAIKDLALCNTDSVSRRFVCYSIYAWSAPLTVSMAMVAIDNLDSVPKYLKTGFGDVDICWFTKTTSQMIFFMIQVTIIFVINGVFFFMSICMICNNSMSDQNKSKKRDFILYTKMGIIMGVTRLPAIAAYMFDQTIMWHVFEVMNSLQGFIVFLLFTCTKKNYKGIKDKLEQSRDTSVMMVESTSNKRESKENIFDKSNN